MDGIYRVYQNAIFHKAHVSDLANVNAYLLYWQFASILFTDGRLGIVLVLINYQLNKFLGVQELTSIDN